MSIGLGCAQCHKDQVRQTPHVNHSFSLAVSQGLFRLDSPFMVVADVVQLEA